MNTIFARGPSLIHRLILAGLLSLSLMLLDHKYDSFSSVRVYMTSLVSPIQYLANTPGQALSWSAKQFVSHQQLVAENARLTQLNVLMSEGLQRFVVLQRENDRLRTLLGSPTHQDARKMVAELMAVDNNPYNHQIIIDKGAIHGVYEGQAVLDDKGIVGQVQYVASTNSRVLLVADVTHAIPVRVLRNNVQLIVSGSGRLSELQINHVPHSKDIRVGDVLVSSGLGKRFPEGYPVAKVSSVNRDESRPFAEVTAEPIALLDRLKYLLLLWPVDAPTAPVLEGEEP